MSKSGNHPWSLDPFETNFGIVVDDDNSSNCKTCVCRACCCFWFVFFWLIALFLVLVSCAAMRTLRITSKDLIEKWTEYDIKGTIQTEIYLTTSCASRDCILAQVENMGIRDHGWVWTIVYWCATCSV
eukprot:430280_1